MEKKELGKVKRRRILDFNIGNVRVLVGGESFLQFFGDYASSNRRGMIYLQKKKDGKKKRRKKL